ncbi:hypothetical protein DAEQUDRAFT_427909 [Daedalea quercina L-15889]|uniref:Uncharacterized protein n=1 Tax=Daedalea quercina L-15889 TaxID=1314783 RepID=A0A165NJ38_9APHY|nr:hypothetical protein DAEQUDRAFT_427909 [Daedalea quercina L-15889]
MTGRRAWRRKRGSRGVRGTNRVWQGMGGSADVTLTGGTTRAARREPAVNRRFVLRRTAVHRPTPIEDGLARGQRRWPASYGALGVGCGVVAERVFRPGRRTRRCALKGRYACGSIMARGGVRVAGLARVSIFWRIWRRRDGDRRYRVGDSTTRYCGLCGKRDRWRSGPG